MKIEWWRYAFAATVVIAYLGMVILIVVSAMPSG